MPEVIMQYEDYEGKMIAMKRKDELIRCRNCSHYVDTGIEGVKMCDITIKVKPGKGYCDEAEGKEA